jgi:hypothetical protein
MSAKGFAAWHPQFGFGRLEEVSIRTEYDHAKTDARVANHADWEAPLWKIVPVEIVKAAGEKA